MDMKDEPGQTSLNRRTMALLAWPGYRRWPSASAGIAACARRRQRGLPSSESTIPGVARVRLREATWAPGAGLETRPMANDMVCRMVQGDLDVTVDGEPATRKEGDLWTCHVGMMISDKNNGSVPAVMHVLDLLPE
jgi:hypothetical protein